MFERWSWKPWYETLIKPGWTPSGQTIGTIWSILYPIIFVTYAIVFYRIYFTKTKKQKIPRKFAAPFIINLVANFAFTPIFFGLKNIPLATLDILVVWITIIWTIAVLWRLSKTLALLQIPYLTWVSIATILQLSILLLN